jgi:hypothetical protein
MGKKLLTVAAISALLVLSGGRPAIADQPGSVTLFYRFCSGQFRALWLKDEPHGWAGSESWFCSAI